MAQFVGCLEGMGEACRALDFPIVSGNVSLYNESKATGGGSAILPTPAIGAVGILNDWSKSATIGVSEGDYLWLVGGISPADARAMLGQSLWLQVVHDRRDGSPPKVDLEKELKNGTSIRDRIAGNWFTAAHDVSDGGLLVALAEMALAGNCGIVLTDYIVENASNLFGEAQGRYVIATKTDGSDYSDRWLSENYVYLGRAGGNLLRSKSMSVSLADLRAAHEGFFPALMQGEL
jgi:phosphoribosylformylglycinamidine synthase